MVLSNSTEGHEALEDEHRELRRKFFEVKSECDDLKEKMKFFSKVRISIQICFPMSFIRRISLIIHYR